MSDLCMFELEENVWDEFSESDDHIVPHPIDERGGRFRITSGNRKKPRIDIVGAASNTGDDTKFIQKTEEINLPTLIKKDMMLDKGPWSDAPDEVFPPSCDKSSAKEVSSLAREEIKASKHCLKSADTDSVGDEFSADGTILGEKSAVDNADTYTFSLGQISSTDDGLNFFDNDSNGKEESDILYYGWPDDIGNFEDVDSMFRSCDSTFGLGSLSNEDDLCWFPSSHSTEGAEDALKLGSKFSSSEGSALNCTLDDNQASKLNSADPSVSDTNKRSLLSGDNLSANTSCLAERSDFGPLQFSNGTDARSGSKDGSVLKEQICSHKIQAKHRNKLDRKRKERNLDTGGSFHCNGNLKQFSDTKSPHGELSHEVFPPGVQQDMQTSGLDCVNYTQTDNMFLQMDCGQSSDLTSICPSQSGIRSKSNGLPSSQKESSFASNRVQSMESAHGQLLEATAMINEDNVKLYHQQGLQSHYSKNFKCANNASPTPLCDPVHNQTRQSEYEVEGQNEFETVSIGVPVELDSSNALESSCMSSALDEISLEASSLQQLQQVMEQLDIRTKLCIRDSLYRLARSAEQRHNCAKAHGDRDTSGALIAEETDKSTAFLDIETDTNPIDRSIAHLLFHRPSDPSTTPTNDAFSLKSHTMVHGTTTTPPLTAKEQVCQEETAKCADPLMSRQ